MATLVSRAEEYFGSLGHLSKKVQNDQENFRRRYGEEEWLRLTVEQQEDLLDKFFVDENTREKYAKDLDESDDRPECFPKLMVPCGEKICVDFDNDEGWTWRDEHSGPFSWKTRSQQDLSLFDEEDEGIVDDSMSDTNKNCPSNKSTPVGTPKRPLRKGKKSPSPHPENKSSLAFKPEKSIWDSPFLAADRGLDSAYPSSHSSDQSKGSDESDHGELINKFGMAAAFCDAVREAEKSDRNSLSVSSDDIQTDNNDQKSLRNADHSPERLGYPGNLDRHGSPSRDSVSSSGSGKSGKKKSTKSKDQKWKPSRSEILSEGEQSAISELSISMGSTGLSDQSMGQVSPVYIEDPGESSSDFSSRLNYSLRSNDSSRPTRESLPPPPPPPKKGKSGRSSTASSENEWSFTDSGTSTVVDAGEEHPLTASSSITQGELEGWQVDLSANDDPDAPKTGFDFLDNW